MQPQSTVDIIVPTTCEPRRSLALRRSLTSAFSQRDTTVTVWLVVNGPLASDELLAQIEHDFAVRTIRQVDGNVSKARYRAIVSSASEFFCFLDDDDELLPTSVSARMRAIETTPRADVAVSNGYVNDGRDRVLVDDELATLIATAPVHALSEVNWFPSPSPLFRRSSVDVRLFESTRRYFELTYLFYALVASGAQLRFTNTPEFRIHTDSDASASKSDAYFLALPQMLLDALRLPLDDDVKIQLKGKYVKSLHEVSQHYRRGGELRAAMRYYLMCLGCGGFEYALGIRHIVMAAARRVGFARAPK